MRSSSTKTTSITWGRAADPDGQAYWLEQFAAGKTNEDLIAGLTGSVEYYQEHTSYDAVSRGCQSGDMVNLEPQRVAVSI